MKSTFLYKSATVLALFALLSSNVFAKLENGEQPANATDSVKPEHPEKIPARMSLRYFKKAGGSECVKVNVWYKEGKKNIPVEHAVVNLYLDEVSREGMLTNLITDENGEGVFLLVDRFQNRAHEKFEYNFIGRMMSEDLYEPTEEEILVKKAEISITMSDKDSSITAVLNQVAGKDSVIPAQDVEMKIGVKRSFGILPIGDPVTTDENGSASVICPADIPGDSLGNLIIIARIEDHDEFGNIETAAAAKWGAPVKVETHKDRTLWASGRNAPVSLVTASVLIVFGIWGVLFYLFFQLFRIKKLSRQ